MVIIFLIIVLSAVAYAIYRHIQNNNSPIISTKATLIGRYAPDDAYYLTFRFINGETKRFRVKFTTFWQIRRGEQGTLTYQGTRFISFQV